MLRILMLVMLLQGCTTSLWSSNPEKEIISIDGFYINKSTGNLFVSARDKAFIFPITEQVSDALSLTRQAIFIPIFDNFIIDKNDQISGTLTLILAEDDVSLEFKNNLKRIGFHYDNEIDYLKLNIKLVGKRYLVEGTLPLVKLAKEYRVIATHTQQSTPTIGKIIATPAAITIDAVVTVPAVFLGAGIMAAGAPKGQ